MATATFTIDNLVYSDTESTNNPQQRDWDYKKVVNISSLALPLAKRMVLIPGNNTIEIPANPSNFLYIEVDGTVKVKLNGMTGTEIDVSPSVTGISDGFFFKRGLYTSLVINNPSADDINALIFMGV